MREISGECAIGAEQGKQTLGASDEIALGAQAATQPHTGDSAKRDAPLLHVMAPPSPLLWRQQVRSVNEDEIANSALKLLDAHVAVATALALSDAARRKPRKQRQQP